MLFLCQVNHQINENRNSQHQIALDLDNKDAALAIDHTAHNLHNNSRYKPLRPQSPRPPQQITKFKKPHTA